MCTQFKNFKIQKYIYPWMGSKGHSSPPPSWAIFFLQILSILRFYNIICIYFMYTRFRVERVKQKFLGSFWYKILSIVDTLKKSYFYFSSSFFEHQGKPPKITKHFNNSENNPARNLHLTHLNINYNSAILTG